MATTGFAGSDIDAWQIYPVPEAVYDARRFTVGDGVEASYPGLLVDFTDNRILFDFTGPAFYRFGSFSGFRFFDPASTIPDIVGVAISTNIVGFSPGAVTFDANAIWVNFVGLFVNVDSYVTLTVQFSPEPPAIDFLQGGSRAETLFGDRNGRAGAIDRILGGGGADVIHGLDGADTLFGDAGDDQLYGDVGDDALYGGTGNDLLHGGSGRDTLSGGTGTDRLIGGAGEDRFLFGPRDGSDVIVDFTVGEDRLVLDAGVAIRRLVERDVDRDFIMDTVVTFDGASGSVTLLGVSGATAAGLVGSGPGMATAGSPSSVLAPDVPLL